MKKRQAIERRLSEGDTVDLVQNQPVVAGGSLDSNLWEQVCVKHLIISLFWVGVGW